MRKMKKLRQKKQDDFPQKKTLNLVGIREKLEKFKMEYFKTKYSQEPSSNFLEIRKKSEILF